MFILLWEFELFRDRMSSCFQNYQTDYCKLNPVNFYGFLTMTLSPLFFVEIIENQTKKQFTIIMKTKLMYEFFFTINIYLYN